MNPKSSKKKPAQSVRSPRRRASSAGTATGDTATERAVPKDTTVGIAPPSILPPETEATPEFLCAPFPLRNSIAHFAAAREKQVGAPFHPVATAHGSLPAEKEMPSPLDLLLPYQRRWVDDAGKFKIGVQSRQTGKSFSTACEAVVDSLRHAGTKWVCLSAGERQALEWLEKCREWARVLKIAIEEYAQDRQTGEALMKQAEIRFRNGSRIIAIPANPSTARGYSANVVLDEFAYHEDPDAIWSAMFPSLTNPLAGTFLERAERLAHHQDVEGIRRDMKIRVVSTFNGRDNKFFELWEKREANGYSGHRVTIHDAIREGLPVDAEALRAGLDDADAWAQEYECDPRDTSAVLLPYDLIAQAESAEASEVADEAFWQMRGGNPVFCGIDFGRSNDPTVCWTLERSGGVLWTREVLVLRNTETPEQVDILRRRLQRATRMALDCTGPGVGLGDYLKREFGQWQPAQHSYGRVELCTFSVALKREMFPLLRRQFTAPAQLRIPISRTVREDLHAMQQIVTNGEYNYWAPRTREGHSDRCTALALAIRAAGAGESSAAITAQTAGMIRCGGQSGTRAMFQPARLG
jgi:phage FluMu gp28-like protein